MMEARGTDGDKTHLVNGAGINKRVWKHNLTKSEAAKYYLWMYKSSELCCRVTGVSTRIYNFWAIETFHILINDRRDPMKKSIKK